MCVLWVYYLQREVNENITTIKTTIKPSDIGRVKESVPNAMVWATTSSDLPLSSKYNLPPGQRQREKTRLIFKNSSYRTGQGPIAKLH